MITTFDNLLILCHDYADAEEKLKKVIHRAYERGLVLKFAKSWLGFDKVTFFGYVVSQGKYGLSQERKDQLSAIPMPANQKQMQRFLGAALFFKSFIFNYSEKSAKLYGMLRDGFDWDKSKCTDDYLVVFPELKDEL